MPADRYWVQILLGSASDSPAASERGQVAQARDYPNADHIAGERYVPDPILVDGMNIRHVGAVVLLARGAKEIAELATVLRARSTAR